MTIFGYICNLNSNAIYFVMILITLLFLLDCCRSLTLPYPKEETLSRHSILGPSGLKGQWRPPTSDKGVC